MRFPIRATLRALPFLIVPSLTTLAMAAPTLEEINSADPLAVSETGEVDAATIRLQVLLARANASPGVIDGIMGSSTSEAVRIFEMMEGLEVDGVPDENVVNVLPTSGPVVVSYTITEEDAALELTEETEPGDYQAMAKLDVMGFHSHREALAERFAMDVDLLEALNPDADFSKAGTEILVANVASKDMPDVVRIEIDKKQERLMAYGADDNLVFSAPASIGSDSTPSPSGDMKVEAIAPEPNYTITPDTLKDADVSETLVIQPGPNGPVGSTWISLTKDGYGIHGTPDPAEIGRTESHGCVRLTNWDAALLATKVVPGETTVLFLTQ